MYAAGAARNILTLETSRFETVRIRESLDALGSMLAAPVVCPRYVILPLAPFLCRVSMEIGVLFEH